MSQISDGFLTTLKPSVYDSERGSLRMIAALLARGQRPNSISAISKQTAANGKSWVRFASGLGNRILGENGTTTSLTFRRYGTNTADVAATLTTALTGANNDLLFTAKAAGAQGNNITVAYVDPSGNNQALAVTVTGTAISVSLATGSGGAITSTAAQIKTAIDASVAAAALVTVANAAANDGTGVVIALAATNLTSGADTSVPVITVASGGTVDLHLVANANEWEFKRTDDSGTQKTLYVFLHNTV